MSRIAAGELNRRIAIQSFTTSADSTTNEEVKTWSSLYSSLAAKRLGPKSNETFEANQQVANIEVRYLIRWKDDITEVMRVIDGSDTYYIKGIEESSERKAWKILTCEKRDNE
jgi:SPP1 family predicted phage head-tail adaptor